MNGKGKKGKVYLVGAGPGDPGLLTLRGRELLERAEVVIYDRLASPRLMDYVNPEAEKIYVGKRIGRHVARQDEINDLIIEKAKEGKMVVRLKGGDPFIFGRGGEEAQIMAEQGVEFEIVPGVTSAIAVPAYAGIPLTHRAHTASWPSSQATGAWTRPRPLSSGRAWQRGSAPLSSSWA
jgi:uroporphyrinogen III methyltransferase/synthase